VVFAVRLCVLIGIQINPFARLAIAFTFSVVANSAAQIKSAAVERSLTAMKCVEDDVKPEDFRRPGHMFPLEAREGGVLKRAGHTERNGKCRRMIICIHSYHLVKSQFFRHLFTRWI